MALQSRLPELQFKSPQELNPVADRLSRIDRARFEPIARLVGLADAGDPVIILLVPEGAELARRTPPWIAGFAIATGDIVVLFPNRSPSYPYDSIEDVLQHEIAHVLIARAAGGQPVPRWFHEGLALIAERPWGLGDRARAMFAIALRRVDPGELDRLFAGSESEQSRAYAIAGAWMRDILARHGSDAAARILREMARGQSFTDAYARATSESLATSARTFWRESWWYQAVPFFTSTFVLWLGVTLLALLAIRTRRARNAERRKRWEDEELRTQNSERGTENGLNGD